MIQEGGPRPGVVMMMQIDLYGDPDDQSNPSSNKEDYHELNDNNKVIY